MKSKMILVLVLSLVFIFPVTVFSQLNKDNKAGFESIKKGDLKAQLKFIASDYTEGRETTSRGYDLAAKYAESLFTMWGVSPGGDARRDRSGKITSRSYFQTVPFEHVISTKESSVKVKSDKNGLVSERIFNGNVDFRRYNRKNESLNIEKEIVFAGYGLGEKDFDEFAGIDVKDKLAIIIMDSPGTTDKESEFYKKYKEKRSGWYPKVMGILKEKGAAGALFVYSVTNERPFGVRYNKNKPWRNLRFAKHYEGDVPIEPRPTLALISGMASRPSVLDIDISHKVVSAILEQSGYTLEELQKKIDTTQKPFSFPVENTTFTVSSKVETEVLNCKNVVGYVEGSDPKLKDELVVIGAHLDHVGKRSGQIYNGADDNGSGSVGVMEIAEAFSILKKKPRRTTVFCLWTGEEHGLYGSTYFTEHPLKPIEKVVFYLNFDMIGRNKGNKDENKNVAFTVISSESPEIKEINEEGMKDVPDLKVDVKVKPKITGGTDYTPFTNKGIPVQGFNVGFTEDYHQITDHINKINFEKMENIVRLGFLNLYQIANKKSRLKFEKDKPVTE